MLTKYNGIGFDMAKQLPQHYDLMGKEIVVGSFVVAELNSYRKLELCVVDKINPKMIRLRAIHANSRGSYYSTNKYPAETMVVDNEEDVTMYILKNSSK
jgi:hypothetical protein